MIELQHRSIPTPTLTQFIANNPTATPKDFNGLSFQPIKQAVKADLNADQGGLCVYCESRLEPNAGQIEHIKPKSGPNAHPHLCFSYTNYAHSCINPKTCGQKKKDGLLPIEPKAGCNAEWILSTDGTIEPHPDLTRQRRHAVVQTRDMLGLNKDSNLVDERQRWFRNTLSVLQQAPNDLADFLDTAPYKYILSTAL